MKLVLGIIVATSTSAALASTVKCSSADQRYSYSSFTSDGGAYLEHETTKLDGNIV